VPVRRDLRGGDADAVQGPGEEALGRSHVARLAQPGVDEVPVPIDRAVPGAPGTIDPDVGLVRLPSGARRAPALGPEAVGEERGEARLPLAHGLVAEDEAARQEHR